jgi:protein-S-isoprenylcysteine O-methyltransferase Ste14
MTIPDPTTDTSGVAFPPPLWYALGFGAGYLLQRLAPLSLLPAEAAGIRGPVGWSLVAAGVLIMGSAVVAFHRAGTTPIPTRPSTAFVTDGPYRFTRNPMYLGWVLVYLGAAILANALWPLLVLPIVVIVVRRRVIAREEAYLERRFGGAYRAYRARVRRWL